MLFDGPIYLLFAFLGVCCLDEFNQIKVSSLVNKLKITEFTQKNRSHSSTEKLCKSINTA